MRRCGVRGGYAAILLMDRHTAATPFPADFKDEPALWRESQIEQDTVVGRRTASPCSGLVTRFPPRSGLFNRYA